MQKQKTRVTVRIAGKDYTIASYDSAEYVNRVAEHINRKMNELSLATQLPAAQLAEHPFLAYRVLLVSFENLSFCREHKDISTHINGW